MTAKSPVPQEGVHFQKVPDRLVLWHAFDGMKVTNANGESCLLLSCSTKLPFQNDSAFEGEGQKGPTTRYLISNLCASRTRRIGLLRQIPLYGDLSGAPCS